MSGVKETLAAAAEAPILLVACDFDGTLAPIVDHPEHAAGHPDALLALADLAALPHTHAAVISGRGLTDLTTRVGAQGAIRLVGSHGVETGSTARLSLTPEGRSLLAALRDELNAITGSVPGSFVEAKPTGVAYHYRRVGDRAAVNQAITAIMAGPARREGVYALQGDQVVELTIVPPDKGRALAQLRERVGATSVVFFGDDTTDEHAFAAIGHAGVGVKIGAGDTVAHHRIDGQGEVAGLLRSIHERRSEFLARHRPVPIEHHSMLSDQRTVALVDPTGRVVWLCLPRVDSAAVFAALLASDAAGVFGIEPASGGEPRQQYLGDSFVLQTTWPTLTVTDYFDCSGGRPYQRAGRTDLVRVIEGNGRAVIRFAPRLDFGRAPTRIIRRDRGLEVDGWPDPIVLFSPGVEWTVQADGPEAAATAEVELTGAPVLLELRYGSASLRDPVLPEAERRRQTERFWSGWVGTLRIPAQHAPQVRRSAAVIKALCHGPTGAIVAAGTTSLPAPLGGSRNWDYRYCWPRDACLAAAALIRLGNTGTAMKLLDWLVGVVDSCESPERLRPIYTVAGGNLGQEGEIGSLPGYGRSRPVRIGNAAAHQVQLDVFGPIVDVAALLAEAGAPVTPQYWRLVESMVNAAAARWQEPDHGIWELRTHKRHNVHTKVMCWHAVSRGMVVAEQAVGRVRPEWPALCDRIAADVTAHGWNAAVGAFTAAYGETTLDAASLTIGLTGLVAPNDPRFVSTVDAIHRTLRRGPTVYRYLYDDGLPGVEGGFNLCTGWLIESLALVGRRAEAEELLAAYAALAGPTGLMAEQFDPLTGLALGNFPQAYSHLAMINAAVRLAGT
ncbi:MAG: trehalose-phosphatase [Phycisphaerales bacterium]